MRSLLFATTALLLAAACRATLHSHRLGNGAGDGPRILVVVAHPDDEIAFAGTLYKAASYLDARCDVAVLTNGEGGFKYATLAEDVYGLELTDEEVGRAHLPAIRERELLAGCALLGVHQVFLLGQRDHRYTRDEAEVLAPAADVWDLEATRATLGRILRAGDYELLLLLAPTEETHGHHKAATILALEEASRLPPDRRPVLLCVRGSTGDEPVPTCEGLPDHPVTATRGGGPPDFVFDRTQGFGHEGRLDYRIVANWAIAEHKSQGTMQLLAGRGDREHYYLFDASPPGSEERARAFFDALAEPQFTR
jgi:LmbE family N-acetylglucosaminyl deacetylase